jgi:hypothetical protein
MMMLGEVLGYASNFFLGFCVMLGAALVFQRSKRAALWFALAGLGYVLAVPVEYSINHVGRHAMHIDMATFQFIFTIVNMGRHVVLFGGLAMGMRTLATESA